MSETESAAVLVHRIGGGSLDPRTLDAAGRRRCVRYLLDEGFGVDEIASVMAVSERTVRRDRAIIRREGAIQPAHELCNVMMGEHHRLVGASIQRLIRLARDTGTPAYVKLHSEMAIQRMHRQLIELLYALQYMPDVEERMDPTKDRRSVEQIVADTKAESLENHRGIIEFFMGVAHEEVLIRTGGTFDADCMIEQYAREHASSDGDQVRDLLSTHVESEPTKPSGKVIVRNY